MKEVQLLLTPQAVLAQTCPECVKELKKKSQLANSPYVVAWSIMDDIIEHAKVKQLLGID